MDFFIALATGVLSGLGIGSGGLMSIWLIKRGAQQLTAQGLNLLFFLFSSSASLLIGGKRRKLLFPLVIYMAIAGCVGTYAGTAIASAISPILLRKLLGGMLAVAGTLSLFGKTSLSEKKINTPGNLLL